MLDSLGWPSLEQRRKTSRLGMMYKIYNGLVQCPIIKTKLVPPPPRQRHTHCQQLSLITPRTQYRGDSFLPALVGDWNSLSKDAVVATTVDTFVSLARQSFFREKELETVVARAEMWTFVVVVNISESAGMIISHMTVASKRKRRRWWRLSSAN